MAAELLPGFRFYPTEEELISFYLANKLQGAGGDPHITQELNKLIPVVDIYNNEPWDLPQFCGEICHRETEQWFFFMPQQEREARGGRTSRTTSSGYWKATGSPSVVYSTTHKKAIGVKKTMVFYEGKAPLGSKTKWKMNEYKAIKEEAASAVAVGIGNTVAAPACSGNPVVSAGVELRHEMSLCRVYVTSRDARAFDRRPPQTMVSNNNITTAGSA